MNKAKRIFPFLSWFPMSGETLRADFIAGLTVAMLLIPQSMAYADLAGLAPQYGLYAAFIPVMLGALFGNCRQLGTGPVAMTSILTAATLATYKTPGMTAEEYATLAIMLSLCVGVIRLCLGIFRLSFVVNLLSHPVISGFTNAGAILIGLSQLDKIFGLKKVKYSGFLGTLKGLWEMLLNLGNTHWGAFAFGIGAMLIIRVIKKYYPKLPAMLIAVIIGILISWLCNYQSTNPTYTVTVDGKEEIKQLSLVVGKIESGLPSIKKPISSAADFKMLLQMLPGACMVALIGFLEVLSVSKVVSLKTRQPLDLDQELIGQGLSAIGGSFFQAYPTSGSFSRTAMNLMTGAKTGLSSIFTGLCVMTVLLFCTGMLYHLPKAVLGAGVIMAVIGLINFQPIKRAWKASKADGICAIATFVATLCFAPDMVNGIFIGTGLTLAFYFYQMMRPKLAVLGYHSDGTMRDAEQHDLKTDDNIVTLRLDGSLVFASAAWFENKVFAALSEKPNAKHIILSADGINRIDSSGEWALVQILKQLKDNKLTFVISGIKSEPMAVLERTGLAETIGKENFLPTEVAAINELNRRESKA